MLWVLKLNENLDTEKQNQQRTKCRLKLTLIIKKLF